MALTGDVAAFSPVTSLIEFADVVFSSFTTSIPNHLGTAARNK
jgi:hypothetical protein